MKSRADEAVLELSSRREPRIASQASDPEQVLKVLLHNCRTKNARLMSSARQCGDETLRGSGPQTALAQLKRVIAESEQALLALRANHTPAKILPFK